MSCPVHCLTNNDLGNRQFFIVGGKLTIFPAWCSCSLVTLMAALLNRLSTLGLVMHLFRIFSTALLLVVAACANNPSPSAYMARQNVPYLLDSGDQVKVTIFGQTELSGNYLVDDAGYVAMPLVGTVMARGVTTQVLSVNIGRAMAAGYLVDPDVAVEVFQYRPFFIQGAVTTAGSYPYMAGMTVRHAVSVAGGYSRTANRKTAILFRNKNGEIVKGNVALDMPIFPGDTVEIAERWL